MTEQTDIIRRVRKLSDWGMEAEYIAPLVGRSRQYVEGVLNGADKVDYRIQLIRNLRGKHLRRVSMSLGDFIAGKKSDHRAARADFIRRAYTSGYTVHEIGTVIERRPDDVRAIVKRLGVDSALTTEAAE